jgi:uncharacterized membrane protein YcaP (DUF421 family)
MEETIRIFDLKRIFLGDLPWTFTVEVIFRTVIMYIYALIIIRIIGKRAMGQQFSPFEFMIIIALGSAVGDPMFYPEVPLLHGMAVLTAVVILQRGLTYLAHQSEKVEAFVEGTPQRLVADGRLDLEGMESELISREELFTELREAGVEQLGQVKRAYLEQNGNISTFLYTPRETRPGLSLIPPWDITAPKALSAGAAAPKTGYNACNTCGETRHFAAGEVLASCSFCEGTEWVTATEDPIEDNNHYES